MSRTVSSKITCLVTVHAFLVLDRVEKSTLTLGSELAHFATILSFGRRTEVIFVDMVVSVLVVRTDISLVDDPVDEFLSFFDVFSGRALIIIILNLIRHIRRPLLEARFINRVSAQMHFRLALFQSSFLDDL